MPDTDWPLPCWRRAHGEPLFHGLVRETASDFDVREVLGFEPCGDGEHDWLLIRKTGVNTDRVGRALARHAGVRQADVGFSGLKDRRAVAEQWFSVRRPTGAGTDWDGFQMPGVEILQTTRNRRKLKRGVHRANDFRILVRAAAAPAGLIAERMDLVGRRGVPNYFGPQRFGRGGGNLAAALELFGGRRLDRSRRGMALSAARAYVFNAILDRRVGLDCWDRPIDGDVFNLDGTSSIFVADVDAELRERIRSLDVHPTAAMWGRGESRAHGATLALESEVAAASADFTAGLEAAGLECARRATRLVPVGLNWNLDGDVLSLEFRLARGSFATAVLRELAGCVQ